MINCPLFSKDTPIYHAMLHIVYAISTILGVFLLIATIFKCPKRIKNIKYQFVVLQFVGNLVIFIPTEGYCR